MAKISKQIVMANMEYELDEDNNTISITYIPNDQDVKIFYVGTIMPVYQKTTKNANFAAGVVVYLGKHEDKESNINNVSQSDPNGYSDIIKASHYVADRIASHYNTWIDDMRERQEIKKFLTNQTYIGFELLTTEQPE